jgi:hypothetical protein
VVEVAGGTGGVEMIERLTGANHKELGFHTYIGAKNPYSVALTLGELLLDNTNPKYRPREILNDVFNRLAAYEDSGLSPEQVQGLKVSVKICEDCWNHAQAKADGRMVVLPCKVGDTIWKIKAVFSYFSKPMEDRVDRIIISNNEILVCCTGGAKFSIDSIGKTVFLTREEAEKALEGLK